MCDAESRISGSSSENSVGKATHTDLPGSSTAVAPADSAKTAQGRQTGREERRSPLKDHISSPSPLSLLCFPSSNLFQGYPPINGWG